MNYNIIFIIHILKHSRFLNYYPITYFLESYFKLESLQISNLISMDNLSKYSMYVMLIRHKTLHPLQLSISEVKA